MDGGPGVLVLEEAIGKLPESAAESNGIVIGVSVGTSIVPMILTQFAPCLSFCLMDSVTGNFGGGPTGTVPLELTSVKRAAFQSARTMQDAT